MKKGAMNAGGPCEGPSLDSALGMKPLGFVMSYAPRCCCGEPSGKNCSVPVQVMPTLR